MIEFRTLLPSEIQLRVGNVSAKGATFLLYKDARCDMARLDERVGAENWQRMHEAVNGVVYCKVGVNVNYDKPDATPRWVWKEDCGSESNMDAEKGASSDSFKRACTNWGIGRELYTAPMIFIPVETVANGNKFKLKNPFVKYVVSDIAYNEKRDITHLIICDENGEVAYSYPKRVKYVPKEEPKEPAEEAETYTDAHCTVCGKTIKGIVSGGKSISADDLVSRSLAKYKKVICVDCARVLSHED